MATVWTRRNVPDICERMIGFSVPFNNRVLVISYEGMHILTLEHFKFDCCEVLCKEIGEPATNQ